MTITWRVVRYDGPTPGEEPTYRGRDVIAVPGDVVAVSTPDGVITGEPVGELAADTTGFYLLTTGGEIFLVLPWALTRLDW